MKNIDDRETTISMNHVHQTSDGFRFYLANLTQPSPYSARQAQIVVNGDPAKYWLTYPGGIILALGIVLLTLVLLVNMVIIQMAGLRRESI